MQKTQPVAEALAALAEFEALPGDDLDETAVAYVSQELIKERLPPVSSIEDIWDRIMNVPDRYPAPVLAGLKKVLAEAKASMAVPVPDGYSWKDVEEAISESLASSLIITKTGRRPKRWGKLTSLFADRDLIVLALADFGPEAMANPLAHKLDNANYAKYSSVVYHKRARHVRIKLQSLRNAAGNVVSQFAGDLGGVALDRLHPLWNRYHPLIWWALQKGVLQKWILEYALRRN